MVISSSESRDFYEQKPLVVVSVELDDLESKVCRIVQTTEKYVYSHFVWEGYAHLCAKQLAQTETNLRSIRRVHQSLMFAQSAFATNGTFHNLCIFRLVIASGALLLLMHATFGDKWIASLPAQCGHNSSTRTVTADLR